jgi:hypothetical protein
MANADNPGATLHVDGAGFDPLKGYGGNTLDHAAPLRQLRVAEGLG